MNTWQLVARKPALGMGSVAYFSILGVDYNEWWEIRMVLYLNFTFFQEVIYYTEADF